MPLAKRSIADKSKEEIQQLRAMERIKGRSILEKIEFWYTTNIPFSLPESAEKKRNRMTFVWEKAQKGYPYGKVANMCAKKFGISLRRAKIEIADANKLFGSLEKTDAQIEKHLIIQMVKDTYRKAVKADDLKGRNQALSNLIKAVGLDKMDPNAIDWEKLQPSLYTIVLDEPSRKVIEQLVKSPTTDFGQLLGQFDTEDAEIVQDEEE